MSKRILIAAANPVRSIRGSKPTRARVRHGWFGGNRHSGTTAVSKLASLVDDDGRFVRFAAVRSLGMIDIGMSKRAEAVTALARALDDTEPDVRVVAAEALLKLGETQNGVATLVDALCGTGQIHIFVSGHER